MLQGTPGRVREYYDEHPISEARVLEALAGQGLGGPLTAEALFEFDQDHYGGLAAVDALAGRAGLGASSRVLDLCAGLGGPAPVLASPRGSAVVPPALPPPPPRRAPPPQPPGEEKGGARVPARAAAPSLSRGGLD